MSSEIYSLQVNAENAGYSGTNVEFMFTSYNKENKRLPSCKTASLTLENGWNTFDTGKLLEKCMFYQIFNSRISVTVIRDRSKYSNSKHVTRWN